MARYIDAELLEAEVFTPHIYDINRDDLIALIAEQPTADVVEVKCRCKDCKHYQRFGRTSLVFEGKNIQCGWCYLRGKTDEEHRMLPFDFCSYGERK